MKCERCGERAAEIQYTEYRDGAKHKLEICSECARELGFHVREKTPPSGPAPSPTVASVGNVTVSLSTATELTDNRLAEVRCPGCGLSIEELRDASLLGCPQCYSTFAKELTPLFRRIHGATRHRGRIPGGECVRPEDSTEEDDA